MSYRNDEDLNFLGELSNEELEPLLNLLIFDKDNKKRFTEQITSDVRYIKNKEVFIYWKECFYPESVDVFGAGTNGVKITFSTYDLNHSFSFVWRDGHVRDFVLENEEKENIPYPEAYTYYLFDYLYQYFGKFLPIN